MKALVYLGNGHKAIADRPVPAVTAPTDALVRMTHTTICGTDLHILQGDVPSCAPGRILGHEGVGIVEAVGACVTRFQPGDRVVISCITACGKCHYCRRQMSSHCESGGWLLGNRLDGTQAEFVRVPFADTSLFKMPADCAAATLVLFSDILPTGFECGVQNGRVQPGGTLAIVGAGPIGLAALLTAQLYTPAQILVVDVDPNRLAVAKRLGATAVVNSADGKAAEAVLAWTGGRGVDTAIEAVGIPATFELCEGIVAPGGTIANIGVHGKKVALHLEELWDRNITVTTRLVDTVSTPQLLALLQAGKLDPSALISHHFKGDQFVEAYDTFARALHTKALKVIVDW